jgi:predicted dehydrogenase
MLKVAVLGAGHLGSIHLKLLKGLSEYEVIGFYDPDMERCREVEKEYGIPAFPSVESAIEYADVVDIVTPTLSHFECAEIALRKSKHLFIEKPITNTLEEAKKLMRLTEEANVKVQIGHVERFNPAFVAAQPSLDQPMFIETHRLAQFNPRGTDVSVVLDLMIHDIDIVLSVVNSTVRKISASGVAVISDTPDIANVRLEFANGCVANLTASRISMKNMRKSRFFQKDAYIAVDFLDKKVEKVSLSLIEGEPDPFAMTIDPGNGKTKQIDFTAPEVGPTNAIEEELRSFAAAITNNTTPIVTIEDGVHALEVAHQILEKLSATANLMES